jgi:hypothetical protein
MSFLPVLAFVLAFIGSAIAAWEFSRLPIKNARIYQAIATLFALGAFVCAIITVNQYAAA